MSSGSVDLEEFGYSWKDRLQDGTVLSLILASCLSLYAFLQSLVTLIVLLFSSPSRTSIPNNLIEIAIGLPLFLLVPYMLVHIFFNLFPAVRTSQSGMEVQVFENLHYKWEFVAWKEIRALYPVVKFGWLYDHTGRCIYLLEIENLSTWHRQLSITFGNANYHAIVLNQSFPNREALLDKIRDHLPEEKTA